MLKFKHGKDDLIPESALYLHCLYVCRKSNQMGYITDGELEVVIEALINEDQKRKLEGSV